MTNPNDNAHPIVNPITHKISSGLTKREHFAAMAMQGLLAAGVEERNYRDPNEYSRRRSLVAVAAVDYADALIAELNRETEAK